MSSFTEDQVRVVEVPRTHQRTRSALGLVAIASVSFHVAFMQPALNCFILLYAYALIALAVKRSARQAFRFGFLAGFLVFAPHLFWFWTIFGLPAICLWAVLSVFTGLFVWLLNRGIARFDSRAFWVAPVLWTGLEYFRGELYMLKFPWLSAGFVFSEQAGLLPAGLLGLYGAGFAIFLLAAVIQLSRRRRWPTLAAALGLIALMSNLPQPRSANADSPAIAVAGIQLEFPAELEIPRHLDRVLASHPEAAIVMLSEYTFDGPVPDKVRDWCRRNGRYLIAGGKDGLDGRQFYNTAFVVGPDGEIIFKQAKSVPIQFFNDGLPAASQEVWESPWGKLAIVVCYDLSYRRVMDRFIRQGAQAILVPFMDLAEWGAYQHKLHARVTSTRAREYRLSIFRIGSSGISQHADRSGRILASAPYSGQEQILAGRVQMTEQGRLPLDTYFAPVCTAATILFGLILIAGRWIGIAPGEPRQEAAAVS